MHILLIEDDLDLGRVLHSTLKAEGFSCEWLRRVVDAPHKIEQSVVDCVLLDLSLPDGSGFDLLARWRRQGNLVPVIVITARSALEDRLTGLDGGADDFLVKPFATAELLSRIRVVLRRYAKQNSDVWTCGDLVIEPHGHLVRLGGVKLDLSRREFHLLVELAREFESVVDKSLISQRLEPLGDPLDFAAVEVHVSNLRRKIGARRIRTVRGVGYVLMP